MQLKVLHLFDFYLPQTMNWACQLMRHTPGVQQWIGAPWVVQSRYLSPEFRLLKRPLQQIKGLMPANEWDMHWAGEQLIRLEYRLAWYKNWLAHRLAQDKPDLIHAHFGPVACHYLDLSQRLQLPLIASFYGYDFQRPTFEKALYRSRYLQLFQSASAITTTGPYTPAMLVRQGCPQEIIHPVPLAVDVAAFSPNPKIKPTRRLRLIQMATITAKKGHMDTLEAFRRALVDCPNLHLTLAGEQQDKALVRQMRQFIASHSLQDKVDWLPAVPHEQVPGFLASFDVFIHPSRSTPLRDSEGAPVAILEAQAAGLPVLSTFHADIPAQVEHGVGGLLFPEAAPEQLAEGIRQFYFMENDLYQRFSKNARTRVLERFDVRESGKLLRRLYDACI